MTASQTFAITDDQFAALLGALGLDDADAAPTADLPDEGFFTELDQRIAQLDAMEARLHDAGPKASYWIDASGRIRDVEIHGAAVNFDLALKIAAHNADRNDA